MRCPTILLGMLVLSCVAVCGDGAVGASFAAQPGPAATAAGPFDEAPVDDAAEARWDALALAPPGYGQVRLTPLTLRIDHAPQPVLGSDGRYHVLYEIGIENVSGAAAALTRLEVLDARNGAVVASLDAAELARRLVVRDLAAVPGRLGAAQAGLLYLHLEFETRAAVPPVVDHRVFLDLRSQPDRFFAARLRVGPPGGLVFDAPLRGPRYIAGDGCCDSVRHIRATLALNGRFDTAQRFAIDWEQLDEQGRIYAGDPSAPASYFIYGKPAYAVADAKVVAARDGLPDSPPGQIPEHISVEDADGNHVVLDLGGGRFALYAHFKPGSVRVRAGATVRRGQVLGLVGTSGRSSEPHLHFHLMDGPSPLASNGLPHRLRQFSSTRRGVSTAAFDQAIIDGRPLPTEPVAGPALRERALPLDLWIVDLPE